MTRGKFITLEGGEGSGKSTQARFLADRLAREHGIAPLVTREPGGTPFAERLREVILDPAAGSHSALAEALVFYAARVDHLDNRILPALAQGAWVISDRFSDSTRVYQGYAGAVDERVLEALDLIVGRSQRPDLTIVIDVPAEIGLARAAVRRGKVAESAAAAAGGLAGSRKVEGLVADRFEGRDLAYHKRLREGFLAVAAADPKRCIVIDGTVPPEEVALLIWQAVGARLHPGAT
jgi:dTMP kinase